MPIDYSKYPSNWLSEIRPRILTRAGNKCEWCDVINGSHIARVPNMGYIYVTEHDDVVNGIKVTRVVLTIAHLGTPHPDGTPGDKHDKYDVRDENLAALCQGCHLGFDLDDHIQHRKENRYLKLGILPMDLQ